MQHPELDHLVVVANSLEAAAGWCLDTSGVAPRAGGQHALMGTHDLLVNLSNPVRPQMYLEILAIDPESRSRDTARAAELAERGGR